MLRRASWILLILMISCAFSVNAISPKIVPPVEDDDGIIYPIETETPTITSTATEMLLDVKDGNISVNEEFKVDIIVKPNQEIDTVAIESLTWDSSLLELTKVEQGDLFNCSLVWMDGSINAGTLTGLCWGCDFPTAVSGKYATLTFRGKTDGYSMISLDDVGVARAGLNIPVVKYNCYALVGTPTLTPTETGNSEPVQIPIFLIVAIVLIIIVIVVIYLLRRGR